MLIKFSLKLRFLYCLASFFMAHKNIPIVVAEGDGIGPEIMEATLRILDAAQANLQYHKVEIGEKVYLQGQRTGISAETWDIIRKTKAFLKAPITTPQGGGFKSLNVTIRTTLGLYANVRPCASYYPFVSTKHPKMDVVIIRENEEDLYTGIEYQQTPEVFQALKIITRPASEKIIRYAFEYAKANQRKKVTCFTKDNILKMTDGLFHRIFDEIAREYPEIIHEHWIVDIGAAKLAETPEDFDVVVLPNLYGDILSDVAAQITGSVGLGGSANIGDHGAMFEAIHGSAPKRAGQNVANPSGLILASVMMLVYLGKPDIASSIHNAWLCTIEDGIHTYDIYKEKTSQAKVGTKEFTNALIARLGKKPHTLPIVSYGKPFVTKAKNPEKSVSLQELIGADVFIQSNEPLSHLVEKLQKMKGHGLKLVLISNRGATVWPHHAPETACVDHWRCRFESEKKGQPIEQKDLIQLLQKMDENHLRFVQVESLFRFDGKPGYSLPGDEQ